MAYFITASVNASISGSYIKDSGSYVSTSIEYSNKPININFIVTIDKSNSIFPNTFSKELKPTINFTLPTKENIFWYYNTTGSRDTDYNSIISLK